MKNIVILDDLPELAETLKRALALYLPKEDYSIVDLNSVAQLEDYLKSNEVYFLLSDYNLGHDKFSKVMTFSQKISRIAVMSGGDVAPLYGGLKYFEKPLDMGLLVAEIEADSSLKLKCG